MNPRISWHYFEGGAFHQIVYYGEQIEVCPVCQDTFLIHTSQYVCDFVMHNGATTLITKTWIKGNPSP